MLESSKQEGRREFFKSVGRNLILGLTGAGVAVMLKNGQIVCMKVHEPCNHCTLLHEGCALPKAVAFRRQSSHDEKS